MNDKELVSLIEACSDLEDAWQAFVLECARALRAVRPMDRLARVLEARE